MFEIISSSWYLYFFDKKKEKKISFKKKNSKIFSLHRNTFLKIKIVEIIILNIFFILLKDKSQIFLIWNYKRTKNDTYI